MHVQSHGMDLETRSIVKARHLMSVLQDQVSGMHAHPQRLQQASYSQTRRSLLTSSSLAEYYGLYWQTQQWPQVWKRSIFIPQSKKSNAKECTNYRAIALISHASKVMLKILQARLQQYVNCEIPDIQAGFRNGRGTRDQIANIRWIMEKARVPEKHLFLLY